MEFEKLLSGCVTNYPLALQTTMHVGGRADFFYIAKTLDKLKNAIALARKNQIDYIVIGKGSNIVISDYGFPGLVIKNETSNLIIGNNEIIVDSGIDLGILIRKLAEKNLGNLEFLIGIPGTVGGAVVGNAGAFGKSIADVVNSVLILDKDNKIKSISNKELGFGYRESNLKKFFIQNQVKNHPVVLSANLKVIPRKKEMILRTIDNYLRMRKSKQPKYFSAGSFFRNIELKKNPELAKREDLPIIEDKIPVGALLEKIGAKNMKIGGASVYSGHANWIINKNGRARAYDIKKLATELKQKIRAKFKVIIQEEVIYIGDFNTPPKSFFEKIFKK